MIMNSSSSNRCVNYFLNITLRQDVSDLRDTAQVKESSPKLIYALKDIFWLLEIGLG